MTKESTTPNTQTNICQQPIEVQTKTPLINEMFSVLPDLFCGSAGFSTQCEFGVIFMPIWGR